MAPKELARRLTGSDLPPQAVLGAMFRTLTRWFGVEGTRALFTRALAIAKAEHRGLEGIKVRDSEPYFEGVAMKAKSNGDATTAEPLEALVVTVIELLERQIGPELTMRLIDPDAAKETADANRSNRTGGNDR
jgi:hypothetical protein